MPISMFYKYIFFFKCGLADIDDHGSPSLPTFSQPYELICGVLNWRFPVHVYLLRLPMNFIRCPLLFLPLIVPSNKHFSSPFTLIISPKNFNCLSLMVLSSDLFYLTICFTTSLVFLSVHQTLRILRLYHISTASSRL